MNTGHEILNQLGGYNKLDAMLGLQSVLKIPNGVSFRFKTTSSSANYIAIKLVQDEYDIEIGNIRGLKYKKIFSQQNVPNSKLKDIIEDICKVRLSL